jgi:hypothetical protein
MTEAKTSDERSALIPFPRDSVSGGTTRGPRNFLVVWADTESLRDAAIQSPDCTAHMAYEPVCADSKEGAMAAWLEEYSPEPPFGHERICLGILDPVELREMAAYLESHGIDDL